MSSGIFLTPLIITTLRKYYGYYGGQLLHGGFLLQGCLAAALFISKSEQVTIQNQLHGRRYSKTIDKFIENVKLGEDYYSPCERIKTNLIKIKAWLMKTKENMKNKKMFTVGLVRGLFHAALYNFYTFLPFALNNLGYSPDLAPWLILVSGVANTSIRLLVIVSVDSRWCCRRGAFVASVFLASVATFGEKRVLYIIYVISA